MYSVHYCTRVHWTVGPVPHAEVLLSSRLGPGRHTSRSVSRALHPSTQSQFNKKREKQCFGSVFFWYGFGSLDPFRGMTDPDPSQDPTKIQENTNQIKNKFRQKMIFLLLFMKLIFMSVQQKFDMKNNIRHSCDFCWKFS